MRSATATGGRGWVNSTVLGIVLATFLSDAGHEMATAILPLYLAGLGLGPAALGLIEGAADLAGSLSRLAGGVSGHYLRSKRPLAALGYLLTAVVTGALALAQTLPMLVTFRAGAWAARGFRGPLRDFLLADAVPASHFARAYGLERAGDMLGAVTGPLLAAVCLSFSVSHASILVWSVLPGVAAAAAMWFLTRERLAPEAATESTHTRAPRDAPRAKLPRAFWILLVGVLLFGMGDFSRSFLILLAAQAFGNDVAQPGAVSLAVLLFAGHNLISALAAYPVGALADRVGRRRPLIAGYALGAGTHLLLAIASASPVGVIGAIALSGVYVAIEETLEKSMVAEILPRELRSLGLGILATANAIGDLVSSVLVGLLLQAGRPDLGFGLCAGLALAGAVWLAATRPRIST